MTKYAKSFDTSLRHEVYASLIPDANFLALSDGGTSMINMANDIYRLKDLIDLLNW